MMASPPDLVALQLGLPRHPSFGLQSSAHRSTGEAVLSATEFWSDFRTPFQGPLIDPYLLLDGSWQRLVVWERRPANAAVCRASQWRVCSAARNKEGFRCEINYQLRVAETSRQRRGDSKLDENAVSVFPHTPSS